jgi:hypothetical protein
MSIQRELVLRYRAEGHVRFQIPARLCDHLISKNISDGISQINGVFRVKLYRSQQKLSIRFHESVCDYKSLAKQIYLLLDNLEKNDKLTPSPAFESKSSNLWKEKVKSEWEGHKATRWVKEKISEAKETIHAAKILTNLGSNNKAPFIKNYEKNVIDFLNDILALYLIKLHWNNITQQWLVKPFKHRYEWTALSYMIFLLVRSRRPK